MATLNLMKLTGLGNDFLVCAADHASRNDWPALARKVCDRVSGPGADGVLVLGRPGDFRLTMHLYNADGSVAEMSGNGIRCLAHAATLLFGHEGDVEYEVETLAGLRRVVVTGAGAETIHASVDMGEISPLDEPTNWAALQCDPMRPVAHLSVGNPHSVVGVDDVSVVPLQQLGELVPHINLEIVEPGPEPDAITMRVHERGAGITAACGTGACASAWVARSWGLVPQSAQSVTVHMDGGDVQVLLDRPGPGSVTLVGPSRFVLATSVEA
jgi:diaminopimelate epimerase